jgi:hypothetical protein
MNFIKFNGVDVRYFTHKNKLYFTANSVFKAIGYIGWSNYVHRHPEDFLPPEQRKSVDTLVTSISWEGLKRFPNNCKADSTRMYTWWTDHHSMYAGFMAHAMAHIPELAQQQNNKPVKAKPVDLTCPEHTHPATVAALRSLPKAKLPPADVPEAAPFAAPVQSNNISGAVYTPALDDFAKAKPAQASPTQQLFSKVTATLNRHKGGEDSFPRIRDYWNESTEEAVALKMALLKIARIENGISVEDSYVDAIGYLALAYNKYKENQNA